jgi:hypothetical protein
MYNLNSTFEDSTDGGQTHPLHEVEESNMLKSSWSLSTGKNPCLHVNQSIKKEGLPVANNRERCNLQMQANHTSSTSSISITSDFSLLLFKNVFSFFSSLIDFVIYYFRGNKEK